MQELKNEFDKNQKSIVELLNRNIDIQYELELLKAEEILEEERIMGKGKRKRTYLLKIMKWKETFYDKDSGEGADIERSKIIEVDGKKSDGWRIIKYYSFNDIS